MARDGPFDVGRIESDGSSFIDGIIHSGRWQSGGERLARRRFFANLYFSIFGCAQKTLERN